MGYRRDAIRAIIVEADLAAIDRFLFKDAWDLNTRISLRRAYPNRYSGGRAALNAWDARVAARALARYVLEEAK